MAGDWIKMEKATPRKPEVLQISESLGIHPDQAFGLCFRFWCWCDDQLKTGHAPSVTSVTLDTVIGHAGFSAALVTVGWLRVRDGSLEVPNFDRHLSASAKNRALSAERQRSKRSKKVTEMSRSDRDKSVTREEKRRISNRREAREAPETAVEAVERPPDGPTLEPSNFDPWLQAFIETWNNTPGAQSLRRAVTHKDHELINAARADPAFEKNMQEALERFPLRMYEAKGTKVGFTKFFEPGFVEKVLDGRYDQAIGESDGKQTRGTARPETRVDASADAEAIEAGQISAEEFLAGVEGSP